MSLELLRLRGVLSDLDVAFALSMARIGQESRAEILLAVALASRAVGLGHVCLDLIRYADGAPIVDDSGALIEIEAAPRVGAWAAALRTSPLVAPARRDAPPAPLVLDDAHRLYLRRYWLHQETLAEAIAARAGAAAPLVAPDALERALERLFPPLAGRPGADMQRVAARMAAARRFCVISGGPGTGKTYTVVRILALLVEQAQAAGAPAPRMLLLAPTGKAAARLRESIIAGKRDLACSADVAAAIPTEAATIHRALGARPGRGASFSRGRGRPLPVDLVLVDEASMVDLALMAHLVDALPPAARLVLLGDQDQLASVEAGAVLGDICNTGAPQRSDFARGIVELTESHRYRPDGGIGRLAAAIKAGDAPAMWAAFEGAPAAEVAWRVPESPELLGPALEAHIEAGFADYLAAGSARQRLVALERFRILCAHRRGPYGVETVNQQVERLLAERGRLRLDGAWYVGRPILVTRNDYQLRLFNGDVGVIAEAADDPRRRVAVFAEGDGVRELSPARLPPHETVFAMSVHKSQGSEFDRVAVLLPMLPSPIVSRELLYTAVTRARDRVLVVGPRAVVEHAVAHRVERASGLRDRLWGAGSAVP